MIVAFAFLGIAALVVLSVIGLTTLVDQANEKARSAKLGGGGQSPSIESRRQPTLGHGTSTDGPVAAEQREWTIARTDDYSHLRHLIDEVTR